MFDSPCEGYSARMATKTRTTIPSPQGRGVQRGRNAPSKRVVSGKSGLRFVRNCTIRRPASELYAFWRNPENIALISRFPLTITRLSDTEYHWSVSAPGGDRRVEWDALIINDEPDKLIAWRSREGAEVNNAGTVRFETAPGDEGTEVTLAIDYEPPAGKLGVLLAKLSGEEPQQQAAETLRRFKALMECGEFPTTEGQPAGGAQQSKRNKR